MSLRHQARSADDSTWLRQEAVIERFEMAWQESGQPTSPHSCRRAGTTRGRLRHPAIVPLHEVGQDGNTTYLVYDFIPGPTLRQLLTQTKPSFQQAARWVACLAEALDYAHQCGIIHRDVKPGNVMMDGDGQPLLADFGLALQVDAHETLTREGDILGTPAYVSPEQAAGLSHKVDGRSDLYSLGVVLYRVLAGELPFRGNSRRLLAQVLNEDPRPLRQLDDTIPRDLETITLKCLAKAPAQRYASAAELAADLRRWLAGEPIHARPIGLPERALKWLRRRPLAAALLALSTAAVAILVVAMAGTC